MNKQEILDEINKTKEHLADLEKKIEECKDERWKPRNYEPYFYINAVGEIQRTVNNRTKEFDNKVIDFYNCFQTKEEECEELKKQVNKQKNVKVQLSKLSDRQLKEFCDMKQALDEIETWAKNACNACKEFNPKCQSEINCRYCQSTFVLNIINKSKENN